MAAPISAPEPIFSTTPTDRTSSAPQPLSQGQEHMLRSDYVPMRIAFAKGNSEKLELAKKFLSQLYGYQTQLSKLQIPADEASAANFSSLNAAFSQTAQKAENLISLLESGKLKAQDADAAFALLETLLNGAKISLFMSLDQLAPKNDESKKISVLDMERPGKRKKAYLGNYSGFFDRITYQSWKYKGETRSRGFIQQEFISEFFKWKADFIYSQTRAFYEQHKSLCNPSSFEAVQQKYNDAMQASLPEAKRTWNWARKNFEALKSLSEECETFALRLSIDVQREQNKTKITPVFGGLLKIKESTRTDMLAWNSAVQTLCALGIGMTGGPAGKLFEKLYFSYHAGKQIAQGDALGGAIFLTALWSGPLAGTLQGLSEGTKAAAKFLSFAGTSAGMYMLGSMAYGSAVTLNDMEKFGFSHEGAAMLVESGVFAAVGIKSGREARKTPLSRALKAEERAQKAPIGSPEELSAFLESAQQYERAGNVEEAFRSYQAAIGRLAGAENPDAARLEQTYVSALSLCLKHNRLGLFEELYDSNSNSSPAHQNTLGRGMLSLLEQAADAYLQQGNLEAAVRKLWAVGDKAAGAETKPAFYERAEKVQLDAMDFGMLYNTLRRMGCIP